MATELSMITPKIKPYIPDCLEPVIDEYVHIAAVELCRRSLKWTEVKASVTLDSGDFPYSVPVTAGTRIVKVLSVVIDGVSLERSDVETEEQANGDWRTTTGTPRSFVEESSGTLMIVPPPSTSVDVAIEVAVEPSPSGTAIDDTVYIEHWRDIQAGAISMLCVMPGKPWTDANIALYNRDIFERGIENAKTKTYINRRVGGMRSRLFDL